MDEIKGLHPTFGDMKMESLIKTNELLKMEVRLLCERIKELENKESMRNIKEIELVQSERYYRSLINHTHDDIMVIDKDYRVTDVNKGFLVSSGYRRKEVLGHYCYKILHGYDTPCDQHGEECQFLMVLKTGQPQSVWHQHSHSSGWKTWVDIRLFPITDEKGTVTHVVKAIQDVSDLVKAGESLVENEKKYRRILATSTDYYNYLIKLFFHMNVKYNQDVHM